MRLPTLVMDLSLDLLVVPAEGAMLGTRPEGSRKDVEPSDKVTGQRSSQFRRRPELLVQFDRTLTRKIVSDDGEGRMRQVVSALRRARVREAQEC